MTMLGVDCPYGEQSTIDLLDRLRRAGIEHPTGEPLELADLATSSGLPVVQIGKPGEIFILLINRRVVPDF